MIKRLALFSISIVLMIGLNSFGSNSELKPKDWIKLGTKKVDFKVDLDILMVGANIGSFNKLKLAVTGGNVNMHRMVVHYQNGTKEEIELRHNFSKQSASRTIDLKGNKRKIKKIAFVYDTKNGASGKAKIHVYGKR